MLCVDSARPVTRGRLHPALGMIVAFKPTASAALADIPARVVLLWPSRRSGDYPVTLEYHEPVEWENEFVRYVEAYASELYEIPMDER